eukprot:669059-Pelagomonas_calceolata.AAC.1
MELLNGPFTEMAARAALQQQQQHTKLEQQQQQHMDEQQPPTWMPSMRRRWRVPGGVPAQEHQAAAPDA